MYAIANHIINTPLKIEKELIDVVKMTFLDTLSALIIGMNEEEQKLLVQTLQTFETGGQKIPGNHATLSLMDAAFVMGTASVAVELDEGNQWSKGHPSVHIFPVFYYTLLKIPPILANNLSMILFRATKLQRISGKLRI